MPARYAGAAVAAFEDDLDTPAALRELRALERDPEVPPGAKFETFAHLDQLFGLDLARDIGKPAAGAGLPEGAATLLDGPRQGPRGQRLGHLRPAARRAGRDGGHGHRYPGRPDLGRPLGPGPGGPHYRCSSPRERNDSCFRFSEHATKRRIDARTARAHCSAAAPRLDAGDQPITARGKDR